MTSIEQHCRDLLSLAIKDGLVCEPPVGNFVSGDPDPQARTAGDLCGMGNMLTKILAETVSARDRRWQKAIGDICQSFKEHALP